MKLKSECGGIGSEVVVVVGTTNVVLVDPKLVVEVVVVEAPTQCFVVLAPSRVQTRPVQHGVEVLPQPRPSGRQTCAKAVQLAKRRAIRMAMYLTTPPSG
jgi:hypothetical protein